MASPTPSSSDHFLNASSPAPATTPAAPSPSDSTRPAFVVRPARTPAELRTVADLFRGYAAWLAIDLSFQSFESELASLPGKYAPGKGGEILLAYLLSDSADGEETEEAVGCIALRDITDGVGAFRAAAGDDDASAQQQQRSARRIGEFKRLYVLPTGRSLGIGNALVERAIEVAREQGYAEVLLDTLPRMQGALKLYKRHGFRETEKYYDTDLEGTIFMSYSFTACSGVRVTRG
ncbi:putative N-acetyltransferase [Lasiodiplodia theobromae]|uniref:Putative N-acetyltransferase n=2 Tax=Lasiodiplodia theobromae TaxID=45133 RepID=A0A5N5CUE2_9PEZI|nr:putative N-acetyltransferase [Lasiodiplodia theobromae]